MNNNEEIDVWIKEILTRLKAIETTLSNLEKSQLLVGPDTLLDVVFMQKTFLHIKRKDDKNISINVLRNTIIIVILQTLIISSNSYLLEYYNLKTAL